jgi:hypothetical protein
MSSGRCWNNLDFYETYVEELYHITAHHIPTVIVEYDDMASMVD